jgi:virulence factor Mce-like protein
MLTRFVRTQLIIFTIASVIAMTAMVFIYLQVPAWFGIGHISVGIELPRTGGLYRFGNVTYRGVQVGRVASVEPTAKGAKAILILDSSPKIPADVAAAVRSASAIGEQYVDLVPRAGGPPYLENGSIIALKDTTVPLKIGPVLDQLSALVKSVPKDKLSGLLDETNRAFNGAGYDMGSLMDSASRIAADSRGAAEHTRDLMIDGAPLLDAVAQSGDALRTWAANLNNVTDTVVQRDPDLRTILDTGPGAADEVTRLLTQIKPTLPVLLANLTSVAQVGVTYNPSLRQLLVLLPPYVASYGSLSQLNNPIGLSMGGFALSNGDPPPCTVGFLPPSQWRSPADETVIDTPDNLYCKLPQDSPIAVRGVRNNPCMGQPGKRAPTVEICDSDQPYEPLAMRQHVLGPFPIDPNQIAQGIPPDSRIDPSNNLYGPAAGNPPPSAPQPATEPTPPVTADPGNSVVAPSANRTDHAGGQQISVASANYDPRTGRYVGSDGRVYAQQNLLATGASADWKDLLPH